MPLPSRGFAVRLFLASAAVGLPVLLTTPEAVAVGTRTFVLDTLDKLSGGDLKGVAVSSDGQVRAGFTLGNVPLSGASAVFSALSVEGGSVLVGTSPNGTVMRVAGDEASVFAETEQTAVTALVEGAGGVIYAATAPEGKIFKIRQGKAEPFATLPDTKNVWGLAYDRAKGALYAAVGPDGRVFRVGADGAASVYFQSDEPNLVSVAVADNGDVLAGSHGKALLYRITGPGRATVLYDFGGDEVRAIRARKDGVVFAVANDYPEALDVPRRSSNAGRTPAAPVTAPRPKAGKGQLYRFDARGRPEKLMQHDDFHYLALALDAAGNPYVGTGAEGRVYTVDDAHVVTLVADTDERQVGALILRDGAAGGEGFVVSGDPAVLHRILGRGGDASVWTSKVLDAGLRARFGALTWRATGPLEVSTRSGDTSDPNGTWSPWSAPVSAGTPVASPGARYLQVRARWARDPSAVLREVQVAFVTENVRPVVLEVTVASRGLPREPLKEALPASGGEPPRHESVVHVSWKVDNADNDSLRYRLAFRREGQTLWRELLKPEEVLTKTEYDWETQTLPEGGYRLRVEASDEASNPAEDAQRHALESSLVLVDNTPPTLPELTVTGRRLRARAADGQGPITRVELAVDGKTDWRPLRAADGIFDSSSEAVDADVTALVPRGPHVVAVRAFDAAGNAVIREIEVP